ncbi:MAG TPA: homoserine dehydrogenase [Candidatus Synoicihabitans sp.]|nr:homoserine dehydrogenase [Candidatus Synoicihabitans sp.]
MSEAPVINVAICGFGTVGQGVWKHLQHASESLQSRIGVRLALKGASVRDLKKARAVRVPARQLTTDPLALATSPEVQIVCELIGGTTIAREVTLAALKLGKTVVSANKALLCAHGPEIFAAARKHGGHFFFEASVAGGIPIIKALREGLVANRFGLIYGILNGTCNYILTRMEREGLSYPQILAEAKALGYAEADESLDVEGWDTAHKASVLAYLAHGAWVPTNAMLVEGITQLTQTDITFARENGFAIKLLAIITRDFASDELSVRVQPTLLPRTAVIANVNDVYNGISVTGDVVGETVYIGRGAGQDATASAVISDIVDAAILLRRGNVPLPEPVEHRCARMPLERIVGRYYLRMDVKDEPGVLARIAGVTARSHVSIASVLQRSSETPGAASLILTTHASNEKDIRATVTQLSRLSSVLGRPLLLRIADFV